MVSSILSIIMIGAVGRATNALFPSSWREYCSLPIYGSFHTLNPARSCWPWKKTLLHSIHVCPNSRYQRMPTFLFHSWIFKSDLSTQSSVKEIDNRKKTDESQPFTWQRLTELFRLPNQTIYLVPSDHPNLALLCRSSSMKMKYLEHKQYLERHWTSAYDFLCVQKFGRNFGFQRVLVKAENDCIQENSIDDPSDLRNSSKCMADYEQAIIPPQGHRYQAKPSLSQASNYAIQNRVKYLRLVHNEYPYDLDAGIHHYCLWKIGGTSQKEGILEEDIEWALEQLGKCSADEFKGSSLIAKCNSFERGKASSKEYNTDSDHILDFLCWVNPPHLQSMPLIQHAHILIMRPDKRDNQSQRNAG